MSLCDIEGERVFVYRTGGVASRVSCGQRLGLAIATPSCSAMRELSTMESVLVLRFIYGHCIMYNV